MKFVFGICLIATALTMASPDDMADPAKQALFISVTAAGLVLFFSGIAEHFK